MRNPASNPFLLGITGILLFLGYTLGITMIGATTGGMTFLLLGKLFVPEMTLSELALSGLRVGTILAGIWAPGVSIVLCFMWGKKQRDRLEITEEGAR